MCQNYFRDLEGDVHLYLHQPKTVCQTVITSYVSRLLTFGGWQIPAFNLVARPLLCCVLVFFLCLCRFTRYNWIKRSDRLKLKSQHFLSAIDMSAVLCVNLNKYGGNMCECVCVFILSRQALLLLGL